MVRAHPFRSSAPLDIGRILAIATAIALHVLALLLLLMPMVAPPLASRPQALEKPEVRLIPRDPPAVPIEVEVTRQPIEPRITPKPVAITPPQPTPLPISVPPVIVEGGTVATVTSNSSPAETFGEPTTTLPVGPIAASHLEYVQAPAPHYPADLIRAGISGTVMLRVLVDRDGKPIEVSIERSSGHRRLDREASQHVLKQWRFKPAMHNGVAVQAYGIVPIAFTLQ